MLLPFSGPLFDCAEGEMKCTTRRVHVDNAVPENYRRISSFSSYDGKLHGWPCIPLPQTHYRDANIDCLDLSDESK